MGKIRRLPAVLANQIAAGEVVERPASVVKELVENALDARAATVEIRLHEGGRVLIDVRDDGEGLGREDLELSVMPHATSKILQEKDLSAIRTLGFRGEALASISAVSRVDIISRPREQDQGWQLSIAFGRELKVVPAGCPPGTRVQVRDLFAEIPARYKFLKSRQTELSHCLKVIRAFAVCWPEVLFTVRNEKRQIFRSTKGAEGIQGLEPLFGRQILPAMRKITGEGEGMKLEGFVASPMEVRLSSRHMYFFLNRRRITSPLLWKAVNEAFRGRLVRGNYPAGALFLEMEPELVDVNVHPTKSEVRFQRPDQVYRLVYNGILRALASSQEVETADKGKASAAYEPASGEGGREAGASQVGFPWGESQEFEEGKLAEELPADPAGAVSTPGAQEPGSGYGDRLGPSPGAVSTSPEAEEFRIIGQFRQSYILSEVEGRLLIFDQHAAHEALLFNRILKEFEREGVIRTQALLFPHVLQVDSREMEALEIASGTLAELGMDVSVFGDRQIAIRAVPYILSGAGEPAQVAEDVIRQLLSNPRRSRLEAVRSCIAAMACSMAVKAGSPLEMEQMASLVEDCLRERVENCPHGRPVVREISLGAMERTFFRQ